MLMRNTGGPNWRTRRLYLNVVASVALYAAPVWAAELERSGRAKKLLAKAMRPALLGAARCYRTVSSEAAAVLAGFPPLELLAAQYARVYARLRELRREGEIVTARTKQGLNLQARTRALARWAEHISAPDLPGQHTLQAIQPCLTQWVDRRGRGVSFRVMQVLSGHGCFGNFLCRITREPTARCHHCDAERDTAQHTLEECPAWAPQRRVLAQQFGGGRLTLPGIILGMLGSEEKWAAMASFCEKVMAAKEDAEWERRPINARGRLGRPRRRENRGADHQPMARPRDGTPPPRRALRGGQDHTVPSTQEKTSGRAQPSSSTSTGESRRRTKWAREGRKLRRPPQPGPTQTRPSQVQRGGGARTVAREEEFLFLPGIQRLRPLLNPLGHKVQRGGWQPGWGPGPIPRPPLNSEPEGGGD